MSDEVCGSLDTADGSACQRPPSRPDGRCRHHTDETETSRGARETTRPDWQIPEREWQRFRRHVEHKHGVLEGYLSREVERAMREYADTDGYERVEQLLDDALEYDDEQRAAGTDDLLDDDRTRNTAVVDDRVANEFRAAADEAPNPYGVELARALRMYREGGRAGRLESKLEQLLDDPDAITTADNSSESDEATPRDELTSKPEKAEAIAAELDEEFTDDELVVTIHEYAARDGREASDPTIRDYRERVTEIAGVERHPENPEVWIPEETAAAIAGEGVPAVCRRPPGYLDPGERAERIQLMVGRLAACEHDGTYGMSVDRVLEEILDDAVGEKTARESMKSAARPQGFTYATAGQRPAIRVDLEALQETDVELFNEIIRYREAEKANADNPQPTLRYFSDTPDGEGPSAVETPQPAAATDGGDDTDADAVDAELDAVTGAARGDPLDE